jgi:Na+-transporting NADH:ubiquinone oxidoreductase subunit NqrB
MQVQYSNKKTKNALVLPYSMFILVLQTTKTTITMEAVMTQLILANLVFFLPMALVGFVLFGEVPVHSGMARRAMRVTGALVGALLCVAVLTLLPLIL